MTITKHGELRGCIGATRGTAPLWKAAADMGTQAACKDPRFTPLTAEELGDTRLEISVLSPMHRVRSPDEIVAGTHGLYIIKGSSSGLLLPQVAREQHWDRNEFLREVCIKAGLPQDFAIGEVSEKFKKEFRVWIIRNEEGFYAIFAKCTHLGCTPRWLSAENKFKCPCHGSGYYKSGVNFEGPAPRPMDRVRITRAEDGQIVVDVSVKYVYGTWDKPGAFLKI